MRMLANLHRLLRGIGAGDAPWPVRAAALLLTFPVFYMHTALFDVRYRSNLRRLRAGHQALCAESRTEGARD